MKLIYIFKKNQGLKPPSLNDYQKTNKEGRR